jgi:hypothetical protein
VFTVIATTRFSQQLTDIFEPYPRMEDLDRAIRWSLTRNPRSMGFEVDGNLYVWVTSQLPAKSVPKVKIVYKVKDAEKEVLLISIAAHVDDMN